MNCILALGFAGLVVAAGLVLYLAVSWVYRQIGQLDFADDLFNDEEDWI
jgi:hypothetical protein